VARFAGPNQIAPKRGRVWYVVAVRNASRLLKKGIRHAERSEARRLTGCFSLKTNKKQILRFAQDDMSGDFPSAC